MSDFFNLNNTSQRLISKELPPEYIRFFAYVIAAGIMLTVQLEGVVNRFYWWVPLAALIYPVASHYAVSLLRKRAVNTANAILILIDSALCGMMMVILGFNPNLCLVLFILVSAGTLTLGGIKGWLFCLGTLILGIMLGLIFLGLPPVSQEADIPTLAGLLGTAVYSSVLGYFSFKQTRILMSTQKKLRNSQKDSENLSRKLAKYLPPQVWGSIFSGQTEVKLKTQRKKLTVFFSDIKGFAEISEELQPEALTDLLNSYFNEMAEIALKYEGTVDKFVGDAILIFFGDPASRGQKQDAVACVSMALEMRKKMKLLRQKWRKEGINKPLQVRMGINTGYCTVGNFGAESRMDYTIIGREVNLASRLESVAQPSEVLISESTYNLVRDEIMCRDRGQINVKGFSKTVSIFEVVDQRKELGATQSFIECDLDGFTMLVDIDKIRNYDKDRVVNSLEDAAKRIREKLII